MTAVESLPKRLLLRAAIGAAVGTTAWLAYAANERAAFAPLYAAAFVLGAAGVCAVARLVTQRSMGPIIGMGLGFLLGVAVSSPSQTGAAAVGEEVVLSGVAMDGTRIDVSKMRGKVVLIDFWATYCPPCREEMPKLKALYDDLHSDGLEVIGVSTDRDRRPVEPYVAKMNLDWPQLIRSEQQDDPSTEALMKKLDVTGIPFVVLVGRDGRIVSAGPPGDDVAQNVRQLLVRADPTPISRPAVPAAGWIMALFGAVAATIFQRSAEGAAVSGGG